ncbi:MAG: FG-GAP-like repeat-containing protein [Sediminibacterium sp.]
MKVKNIFKNSNSIKFLTLLIIMLCSSKTIAQNKIQIKLSKHNFNLTDSIPKEYKTISRLGKNLLQSVCGIVLYTVDDKEHLVIIPADDSIPGPSLHFIKKQNNWVYESYYKDLLLDGVRNYSFMDNKGSIAFAQHGTEAIQPWPLGDIIVMNTTGDKLRWQKVSKNKAFFHSVASGDMNNDGLIDVVGMHMGTDKKGWVGVNGFIPFTQKSDGTFEENQEIISDAELDNLWKGNHQQGAIILADVIGDKRPELIKADYGQNPIPQFASIRYSFAIYQFNPQINKYQFLKENKELGVFQIPEQGASSIKSADFNKDGFMDLAIASEGKTASGKPGGYIQIWKNDGNANFTPIQEIECVEDSFNFREFEVADINNDGFQDILMHGRENHLVVNKTNKVLLNKAIWMNKNGKFTPLLNEIEISRKTTPDGNLWNMGSLKVFYLNGKLTFFGVDKNCNVDGCNDLTTEAFNFYEASVTFCDNIIKPIFNTNIYSFCSGDSLKLSITNVNQGDTIKWYYGSKSDLTNVVNKTFTDSTKLFVTRTDKLGCISSSDTINLVKFPIPPAPLLSRDTASNLVANANGITWYKDGIALSDTTQKLKPTTPGSYTAKTTQNGCISPMSSSYYYLVTDIIHLSNGEFIKIAPNPFINQVNLDFKLKGYQKLNLDVFEMTSGNKVFSRQGFTAGMTVSLAGLSPGTYIIKITSNDNKIVQQFKMVRM